MIRFPLMALLFLPSAAGAEEPAGSAPQQELTIEGFLQNLSTVPNVTQRLDPFQERGPPFEIPVTGAKDSPNPEDLPTAGAPVLERYPITDYEVLAVLLGDRYPRALVRTPKEGSQTKVVIVKEKDKLGNRKGVIDRIVLEGVVVQQALRSKLGFVDKTEFMLRVGGKAEDQRKSLAATTNKDGKGDRR